MRADVADRSRARSLAAVMTAVAALALTATACGSDAVPPRRHGASATPATATTGRTSPPAAGHTQAASAAGTVSPFQLAQAWFASVQAVYTSIQQDTEAIKMAAGRQDLTSVKNACKALAVDNEKARLAPAPPDRLMVAAVGSATEAYAKAAQACLSGDYATTATEIDQGAYYLSRANDLMNNMN